MKAVYDTVVAGAGCAGLSLALRLLAREPTLRLAIVDREHEGHPHKHWSYWAHDPSELLPSALRQSVGRSLPTWQRVRLAGSGFRRTHELQSLSYATLRSSDFERSAWSVLRAHPGVEIVHGEVVGFGHRPEGCTVRLADGHELEGRYVFQSCMMPRHAARAVRSPVLQHFGGWVVKTRRPVFDPTQFTLMDFDVPQLDGPTFFYVLPFNEREALVESTVFSTRVAPRSFHDAAVRTRLARLDTDYTLQRSEYGVIPMFERSPESHPSPNLFSIGVAGGMAKATTGYAFARTQRQVEHLARTWLDQGKPRPLPSAPRRFAFYDAALLDLIARRPTVATRAFERLMATANPDLLLRFLDEKTGPLEEARLLLPLPWGPFLASVPRALGDAGAPPLALASGEASS